MNLVEAIEKDLTGEANKILSEIIEKETQKDEEITTKEK